MKQYATDMRTALADTLIGEYNVRFTDMAIKLLLFQNLYFIPIETYTAGLK